MLKLKIKHMWIINCYIPQKRFDLITYPCNLITYPCNFRFMSVRKSPWCPTMSSEVIGLTIASFISIHLLLDCLFVTVVCSSCHQRKPQSFASLALCEGNPPVVGGSPSQRTSNAESISMSWYYHDIRCRPLRMQMNINHLILRPISGTICKMFISLRSSKLQFHDWFVGAYCRFLGKYTHCSF